MVGYVTMQAHAYQTRYVQSGSANVLEELEIKTLRQYTCNGHSIGWVKICNISLQKESKFVVPNVDVLS